MNVGGSGISDAYKRFASGDISAIRIAIVELLQSDEATNSFVNSIGDLRQVISLQSEENDATGRLAKGSLLYIYFHYLTQSNERSSEQLSQIASEPSFIFFVKCFYDITRFDIDALDFHACGTTSFIFRARVSPLGQCALKLIQAPYTDIPDIRLQTKAYVREFSRYTQYAPKVFDSAEGWILMEFIDGQNLSDYLAKVREDVAANSDTYLSNAAAIIRKLTTALSYYEEKGIIHGDLTPYNILVELEGNAPKALKLIDFGPNYVLKSRVGTRQQFVETFSRTELFVAPEVIFEQKDATKNSDLYSLGMIILELLSRESLRRELVGVRLREIWKDPRSLGFSQLIEDLIDYSPSNRALLLRRSLSNQRTASLYLEIDLFFQEQLAAYRELATQDESKHGLLALALRGIPDVWKAVENIVRIRQMKANPYNVLSRGQKASAEINVVLQGIIVGSFLWYTAVDLKVYFLSDTSASASILTSALRHWLPSSSPLLQFWMNLPKAGDLWGNLPGRLVALTFGLIATRYYANIFATLRIVDAQNTAQRLCNVFLRLNSASYFIPIMAAIVVNPHWWPVCSFLGTLFPALNNYFCWRIAKAAWSKAKSSFSTENFHEAETEQFLIQYKQWWRLMIGYSLGIALTAFLLQIQWAHDEYIYASFVCLINIVKIYPINCVADSPPFVLGNLSRLFFLMRRHNAKHV